MIKRLGAGPSSKAAALNAAISGNLEEVGRRLEKPVDRNRGVFERVLLESVRPDPDNPRSLNLTWDELRDAIAVRESRQPEESAPTGKAKAIESIAAKAASFKKLGQLLPIIVYRDDRGMYRIVDGEMRYWAARLCEWTEIEAKVRQAKPTYLRREQYAANVLRDDLTLAQQLNNLELMLEEAREGGESVNSLNELAAFINRPRTTVQYWWSILRSETNEDVKQAIRDGGITSLEAAYTATQEPDAGRRAALLSGQAVPAKSAAPKATARRGRKLSAVQLGKAKDLQVVRQLIDTVGLEADLGEVDWADARSVQGAWQKFMKAFASHVKRQGAQST